MNRPTTPVNPLNAENRHARRDVDADKAIRQTEDLASLVAREIQSPLSGTKPSKAGAAAAAHSEEESLQSYLDQFMERLTGKKSEAAEAEAQQIAAQEAVLLAATEEPQQPREFARPPECREQLAAMRQLANENARSAVSVRLNLDLLGKTRSAFRISAAISLCSSVLAIVAVVTSKPEILLAAVLAGLAAIIPVGYFFVACGQLNRSVNGQSSPQD